MIITLKKHTETAKNVIVKLLLLIVVVGVVVGLLIFFKVSQWLFGGGNIIAFLMTEGQLFLLAVIIIGVVMVRVLPDRYIYSVLALLFLSVDGYFYNLAKFAHQNGGAFGIFEDWLGVLLIPAFIFLPISVFITAWEKK